MGRTAYWKCALPSDTVTAAVSENPVCGMWSRSTSPLPPWGALSSAAGGMAATLRLHLLQLGQRLHPAPPAGGIYGWSRAEAYGGRDSLWSLGSHFRRLAACGSRPLRWAGARGGTARARVRGALRERARSRRAPNGGASGRHRQARISWPLIVTASTVVTVAVGSVWTGEPSCWGTGEREAARYGGESRAVGAPGRERLLGSRSFRLQRETKRWRSLYKGRASVEREFGRLKNEYGLARLAFAGLGRAASRTPGL